MSKSAIAFFLTVIFAGGLFFLPAQGPALIATVGVFTLLCLLVDSLLYRKQLSRFSDFTFLCYPLFWIAASLGLAALMPDGFWQVITALLLAMGFWKLQLELSPFASSSVLDNIFFFSVFGIFLAVWAADFYFTPGWWVILASVFALGWLFFWTAFFVTDASARAKLVYSSVLAFLLMQVSWAMLFLPLHFFSLSLVLSGVFYVFWHITRFHLQKTLTREKTIFYIVFASGVEVLAFLTTAWLPKA